MIKVSGKPIIKADPNGVKTSFRFYTKSTGLECKQVEIFSYEDDYSNGQSYRISPDNGRSWGEWFEDKRSNYTTQYGEDELIYEYTKEYWNPIHRHYVSIKLERLFIDGHIKAYENFWKGKIGFLDHQYILIRNENDEKPFSDTFMKYENGIEFNPENPRDPEYLFKNRGYMNPPIILKNGDIAVPVSIPVRKGCEMAGLDVNNVYTGLSDLHSCVIIARGVYNCESKKYDFTFSNPVILSDLQSTRGIEEPVLAELENGRIILVMRASNEIYEGWGCRMEPNTPNFKWYAFSDDGGKNFTQPLIWHFDNREVIYSCCSISDFIRSSKTKKLYWIGNITDHTAYGNMPRYPLCIVEIDEKLGIPKKESYTVIDTRRETEPDRVQLSNFSILEDRETKNLELTLIKYSQYENDKPFYGETWQYDIEFED